MSAACARAPLDERADTERIARLGEIGVVARRQHGDAENAQGRALGAPERSAHGLRIGVNGEELCAEPGDLRRRALNRVRDVVQLQVDEHAIYARSISRLAKPSPPPL